MINTAENNTTNSILTEAEPNNVTSRQHSTDTVQILKITNFDHLVKIVVGTDLFNFVSQSTNANKRTIM